MTQDKNISVSFITYTYWKKDTKPSGNLHTCTWAELCEWIKHQTSIADSKGDLPLIKLATFAGNYRKNDNLLTIYGLEGDYDGEAMQPETAAAMLQSLGIAALVYTSASHTPERPRWRVLAPLSRPYAASDRRGLLGRLNGLLGDVLARESFTPSLAFYVGRVRATVADYRTWRVDGEFIDRLPEFNALPCVAPEPTARGDYGPCPTPAPHRIDVSGLAVSNRIKGLIHDGAPHGGRSDALWEVAYALAGANVPPSEALSILTDPANYISAKAREKRNGAAWLWRHTVGKAYAEFDPVRIFGAKPVCPPPGAYVTREAADAAGGASAEPSTAPPEASAQRLSVHEFIPDEIWYDDSALTPSKIVDKMYFADVGVRVAPGGIGKTTLALWEAIHIAIMTRLLFGNFVCNPGATVLLTKEDSSTMLYQRLRKMCEAMQLSKEEVNRVRQCVKILDIPSHIKFNYVERDTILVNRTSIDHILAGIKRFNPKMLYIDPAISYSIGEHRINDSEQGLIDAGRMIRDTLNCCVLFIHHTGKGNAREGTLDQYSGRGGSAFADGSRMVQVLKELEATDWRNETGDTLSENEQGIILARPKLSYVPRHDRSTIFIKRKGWLFEAITVHSKDDCAQKELSDDAAQILNYLKTHMDTRHSKNTIEQMFSGKLPRGRVRAAISYLENNDKITKSGGYNGYYTPNAGT